MYKWIIYNVQGLWIRMRDCRETWVVCSDQAGKLGFIGTLDEVESPNHFLFLIFFKPFWGIFSYFEQSVDLFLWSWQCFLYWFKTDIRKTRENISSTFQCIRQEPILKGSCITPVCLLWKNIGETELPNTEFQMAKIRVHNLFQQNGSKNKIYMFLNKFFI